VLSARGFFDDWEDFENDGDEIDEDSYFDIEEATDNDEAEQSWLINIDDDDENVDIIDFSAFETVFDKQLAHEVRMFLSDELWEVVQARYWYGYRVAEIATSQGVSPIVIQKKLQKARDLLKSYFDK
jgi:hypothetical protein